MCFSWASVNSFLEDELNFVLVAQESIWMLQSDSNMNLSMNMNSNKSSIEKTMRNVVSEGMSYVVSQRPKTIRNSATSGYKRSFLLYPGIESSCTLCLEYG